MSLAASERRELARMERALRQSDPKLAALLTTFNRLHHSEDMPRREFLLGPARMRWLMGNSRSQPQSPRQRQRQSPHQSRQPQRHQMSRTPRAPRADRAPRTGRPA